MGEETDLDDYDIKHAEIVFTYYINPAFDSYFMLDTPELIRNRADFERFLDKIKVNKSSDFIEKIHGKAPDSKTKVLGVFQMMVKIYNTNDPNRRKYSIT